MAGFNIYKEPEGAERRWAPLGDAETYDIGDPVQLVSQQLSDCPDDGTELLNTEVIGFAIEPAEGIHAASRTGAANGFGAEENDRRTYIPWEAPGLLIITRNYYTAGAQTQIAKPGSDIGTHVNIVGYATNTWGLEDEDPTEASAGVETEGDDARAHIVAILDNDMQPIDADGSVAAGEGWVVFQVVGSSQLRYGGA